MRRLVPGCVVLLLAVGVVAVAALSRPEPASPRPDTDAVVVADRTRRATARSADAASAPLTLTAGLGVALAGLVAGTVNTIVGSGSLVSFPALLAVGFPPLVANVSNSVGLVPGSVSGAVAYRRELSGQRARGLRLAVPAVAGGLGGAALLLTLPPGVFEMVVPALVGISSLLVLLQPRLRRFLQSGERAADGGVALTAGVFLTSVYGGYFGAAQGVLLLSVLGLLLADHLQRLNAMKNVLAATVNGVAGGVYLLLAPVAWPAALVLAASSVVGGQVGGHLGRRIPETGLRIVVGVVGLAAAVWLQLFQS
ncbi:sulfite exporter TauE/SafE family protein [soil metagenome]